MIRWRGGFQTKVAIVRKRKGKKYLSLKITQIIEGLGLPEGKGEGTENQPPRQRWGKKSNPFLQGGAFENCT